MLRLQILSIMRRLLQFHHAIELQSEVAHVHQDGQGDGAHDM